MSVPVPVRGAERIRRALLGAYPLLYVQSWEEGRVERALAVLAQKFYERPVPFATWTCVDGWNGLADGPADTRDPLRALDAVLQAAGPGFFLMKDLPALLDERPDVVRRLRDAYRQLKGKGKFVVMVSPRLVLPEDMKKEVFLVDYDLPDEAEVRNAIGILAKRYLGEGGLAPADADRVVTALRGQTLDELEHV
ncbi:MAG: hypothetical protein KJ062_19805, partial [Thermoanaerobaculia bacterium]|nr:hypothetical protein [Thermoanaerobaculia bacterium]